MKDQLTGTEQVYPRAGQYSQTPGIELRTHIAVLAMQALLSNPNTKGTLGTITGEAVEYADRLIETLNAKQ